MTGRINPPDIFSMKQVLFHIVERQNDITVSCDNIVSYGDVLFLTLSLENRSSTDYRIEGATFRIEPKKNLDRTALQPKSVFARNRWQDRESAAARCIRSTR